MYVDTQIIVPGPGRGTGQNPRERMVHSGFRFPSADERCDCEPARAGLDQLAAAGVRARTARAPLTARRYGQSARRERATDCSVTGEKGSTGLLFAASVKHHRDRSTRLLSAKRLFSLAKFLAKRYCSSFVVIW
jgi:hypothetical protein